MKLVQEQIFPHLDRMSAWEARNMTMRADLFRKDDPDAFLYFGCDKNEAIGQLMATLYANAALYLCTKEKPDKPLSEVTHRLSVAEFCEAAFKGWIYRKYAIPQDLMEIAQWTYEAAGRYFEKINCLTLGVKECAQALIVEPWLPSKTRRKELAKVLDTSPEIAEFFAKERELRLQNAKMAEEIEEELRAKGMTRM